MTEREKMLAGQSYDSRDPELLHLYHRCRSLLQAFNGLDSENLPERTRLLRELLHQTAPSVWIEAPFFCDYGAFIEIGAHTFVNVNCVFVDNNWIRIGRNGLIGPGVHIYTSGHPIRASERVVFDTDGQRRYLTHSQPVTIGDNVWIGGNSVILPGVTVGDNAVVGANSTVTRDVPANCLVAGSPARVMREID